MFLKCQVLPLFYQFLALPCPTTLWNELWLQYCVSIEIKLAPQVQALCFRGASQRFFCGRKCAFGERCSCDCNAASSARSSGRTVHFFPVLACACACCGWGR